MSILLKLLSESARKRLLSCSDSVILPMCNLVVFSVGLIGGVYQLFSRFRKSCVSLSQTGCSKVAFLPYILWNKESSVMSNSLTLTCRCAQ